MAKGRGVTLFDLFEIGRWLGILARMTEGGWRVEQGRINDALDKLRNTFLTLQAPISLTWPVQERICILRQACDIEGPKGTPPHTTFLYFQDWLVATYSALHEEAELAMSLGHHISWLHSAVEDKGEDVPESSMDAWSKSIREIGSQLPRMELDTGRTDSKTYRQRRAKGLRSGKTYLDWVTRHHVRVWLLHAKEALEPHKVRIALPTLPGLERGIEERWLLKCRVTADHPRLSSQDLLNVCQSWKHHPAFADAARQLQDPNATSWRERIHRLASSILEREANIRGADLPSSGNQSAAIIAGSTEPMIRLLGDATVTRLLQEYGGSLESLQLIVEAGAVRDLVKSVGGPTMKHIPAVKDAVAVVKELRLLLSSRPHVEGTETPPLPEDSEAIATRTPDSAAPSPLLEDVSVIKAGVSQLLRAKDADAGRAVVKESEPPLSPSPGAAKRPTATRPKRVRIAQDLIDGMERFLPDHPGKEFYATGLSEKMLKKNYTKKKYPSSDISNAKKILIDDGMNLVGRHYLYEPPN